jgi:hypothetical protein
LSSTKILSQFHPPSIPTTDLPKIHFNVIILSPPRLNTEELHNLYSSPSIIRMIKSRRMRWAGHVERMEAKRNAYRILVESQRPLGRQRCRWMYKIKMDLREIGCGDMDWIDLAQNRDQWQARMNMVMNLRVP